MAGAGDLNDGGMHEHQHGHQHEHDEDEENVFTQEYWDARYAASQRVWSGNANLRLVELAADLAPGTARHAAS